MIAHSFSPDMADTVNSCIGLSWTVYLTLPAATVFRGSGPVFFYCFKFAKDRQTLRIAAAPESLTGEIIACMKNWNAISHTVGLIRCRFREAEGREKGVISNAIDGTPHPTTKYFAVVLPGKRQALQVGFSG